jgi:hypothetical protein
MTADEERVDPWTIIPADTKRGIIYLVGQLIEVDAELDTVRVIATRVCPKTNQAQIVNHVWGNRILADAAIDLVNEAEQEKYDRGIDDAESE